MFFSVQLLLAKDLKCNEIKEAYKIQAKSLKKDDIVLVQLLADKTSWEYCDSQT